MKLHKGDTVQVVAGKDKGKTSTVEKVLPSRGKVLVADVNQYKRHVKGRAGVSNSEIVTLTRPLPVSNVALVCSNCKKITRVGFEIKNDKKVRVCRKCGKQI